MKQSKREKLEKKVEELHKKLQYSINVKKRVKYNVQLSRIMRKLER